MVDPTRLWAAHKKARKDLLDQRTKDGHWEGRLSSSPLATATAISALVLAEQHGRRSDEDLTLDQVYQGDLSELIVDGLHWLASQQNADGGWGDTDKSLSNVATSMLVMAAFNLTGVPARYAGLLDRGAAYVRTQDGASGLWDRYGRDRTFAVPILTNCALAGMVPWSEVPPLPFELACVPQSLYRWMRLPVVSYAIPALVAVGLARFCRARPFNPITRCIRSAAVDPGIRLLERMQPESGGFLEAVPLTSFVVMGLASAGHGRHAVVRRGVEFLLGSARGDGSWPIDTNLSIWNTTLALQALAAVHSERGAVSGEEAVWASAIDWIVTCQQDQPHPLSGAAPGGWAWTDRPGGVPDVDDTSAALLTLSQQPGAGTDARGQLLHRAARRGVCWLLDVQNADGGWPTFCRGWGRLPFDRSGSDLTAHAMRALSAWRSRWVSGPGISPNASGEGNDHQLTSRINRALQRGWDFLLSQQRDDGSWIPLWFGNQFHPQEENPVYGTARVLLAFRDLWRLDTQPARRAMRWLCGNQRLSGGWDSRPETPSDESAPDHCGVEETAVATEALLAEGSDTAARSAADRGIGWLVHAVESGHHRDGAPVGLYFARLWYYENLYPLIFSVSALGRAISRDGALAEVGCATAQPGVSES